MHVQTLTRSNKNRNFAAAWRKGGRRMGQPRTRGTSTLSLRVTMRPTRLSIIKGRPNSGSSPLLLLLAFQGWAAMVSRA